MTYRSCGEQFAPVTDTPCPHCGQMALESAAQPALRPGRETITYLHCANTGCAGFHLTRGSLADFAAALEEN